MQRRKEWDRRKLIKIAARAIIGGYGRKVASCHVHLDLAGKCLDPYGFTLYSRGGRDLVTGRRLNPMTVTGQSSCRKCEPCRERKSRMWVARAIDEMNRWRTSMVTFTLSPENDNLLDNRARVRLRAVGRDFDCLAMAEMLGERAREFGAEVTNWLKVVRQGPDGHKPCRIRYLLVAEVHDSHATSEIKRGRPHYHMLLHEVAGSAIKGSPLAAIMSGRKDTYCDVEAGEWECRMVRERDGVWRPHAFARDESFLRRSWRLGHSRVEFCSSHNSAFYVCKYLQVNEVNVRVRASQKYGRLGGEYPPTSGLVSRRGSSLEEGREILTPPQAAEEGCGELQGGSPRGA